jgi:lipoprotein-anchoring transpeptidase ErfK/SrfK
MGGSMRHGRIAVGLLTGAALIGSTLLATPQASAATVAATVAAAPQAQAQIPTAGLTAVAPKAAATAAKRVQLDRRCRKGRVVCVDKSSRKVYWVVNGKIRLTLDARFGGKRTPTREGSFRVYRKSRHHVSSLYHTKMPFAMFFKGGQAVHYSPDFARKGYRGASHGCVNTRQWSRMKALYGKVRIGDRVVVSK